MTALIFDCDGVLADTELDGHLPAFNATFAEFGLPIEWSAQQYRELVRIGGGKERIRSVLTPDVLSAAGVDAGDEAIDDLVGRLHRRKSALYKEMVGEGRLPARPGVARLAAEARGAGWTLAVASTSAEESVRAVLEHAVGYELAGVFGVFAGDVVEAKKPAPDIYELALREIGHSPDDAVVVEDSENGVRASAAAGIRTVMTLSGTSGEDSRVGAALVVSSLGDPGDPAKVVEDPFAIAPGDTVDVTDLSTILEQPAPQV